MLLTADLGNTKLKLGLWDKDRLLAFSVFDSRHAEYKTLIINFLYKQNVRTSQIDDAMVSSVLLNYTALLCSDIEKVIGHKAINVTSDEDYGMNIPDSIRKDLSSDIYIMCVYAYHMYRQELMVISFDSATVISHIGSDFAYLSNIIAPGFEDFYGSLSRSNFALPEIRPEKKDSFIASNITDAMNIGLYDGYIGMIRYLLNSLKKDSNSSPFVLACGDFGKLICPYIREINDYTPDLVSTGLNFLYGKYYS